MLSLYVFDVTRGFTWDNDGIVLIYVCGTNIGKKTSCVRLLYNEDHMSALCTLFLEEEEGIFRFQCQIYLF